MSIRVSTIIPAFNAERTIAETLDSALSQQCEGHEVIVVNDGSTDATASILNGYGQRIRVVTQANRGPAAARNTGVAHATGKYLAFLDADDLWLPGKLAIMTAALERNPAASLAFSEYGIIDENGTEHGQSAIGEEPWMRGRLDGRPFPICSLEFGILPSTWVVPRSFLERSGGFSEAFKGAGYEDLWVPLLLRELGEFVYVPEKLTLYRAGYRFDKYLLELPVFVRLVRGRYGRKAKGLIRLAKNGQCRAQLSNMAHQMNCGDRIGAMHSLIRIAKLRPTYFLSSEFIGRLFLLQNLKRVRDLTAVLTRARQQSESR